MKKCYYIIGENMDKANKNRFIFWGSISLILFICFIIGMISYYNGYGKYGKIRKELNPIVNTFNNLDSVKSLSESGISIKAKFSKDKINVVYKLENILLEYNFDYITNGNIRVLSTSYDNSKNDNINSLIMKFMIDSISIINGHNEGDVFKKFTLDDFKDTTINEGISIKKNGNETAFLINIDKYIVDNYKKPELIITDYIEKDKLNEILSENKSTIKYSDENVTFKINKNLNLILISSTDESESRMYRLICNIIEILYNDKYESFINEYKEISKDDYSSELFSIRNIGKVSDEEFNGFENVMEVIIN